MQDIVPVHNNLKVDEYLNTTGYSNIIKCYSSTTKKKNKNPPRILQIIRDDLFAETDKHHKGLQFFRKISRGRELRNYVNITVQFH